MFRFLEGEPLLYNGWIWIVKGVQHPDGYVVAYPRYCVECIPPRKLFRMESLRKIKYYRWDCIGLELPVVPKKDVKPFFIKSRSRVMEFMDLIIDLSGIDRDDVLLTGSLLIGYDPIYSDIDLVFYGESIVNRVYDVLRYLRESGVTSSLGPSGLLIEYDKHRDLSFDQYIMLRRNSLLQGYYMKKYRYTIRLVPYDHGYNECIDRVVWSDYRDLTIKVIEPIKPYTTPALYRVKIIDSSLDKDLAYMVSFRIRYTELDTGVLLHGVFRIEKHLRDENYYIIPDHSSVKIFGYSS
ncbi:MAG: hypothetical protein DRO40_06225 [Thermoprotei archaeon]|nr:MAG: hypothetical protein DRO40_06225 [Thermoprotei archaeon]